ncbi:hypothetical protein PG984_009404 [Apiospora sp. TS-2023a]
MYSANYNGFPNTGQTFNGAPHSSQNPHMQPGQAANPNQPPQQHHPQQQQPQQMMYNPQQYPMGHAQGPPFPGAPNMMPGVGPAAGMMQNTGMPHMANGQMPNYPTPYSNSPYGAGIPTSVPPQMNAPPNYAMGAGMPMPGFPMHPSQMNPQQQQQMMQRPGPQGTPTPTPSNGMSTQQPQFAPPPNHQGTPQSQTPSNAQQPQQPPSATIQTPQTPTFPSNVHAPATNGTASTPLSPGADSRDKERVSVILEINNELLVEAMQLQHTQSLLKKEHTSPMDGALSDVDKKNKEDEELLAQDYLQCMRRLQTNLSYLAALADKKGALQAPPCPMYLKPPPLHTKVKLRPMQNPDGGEAKPEASDREETAKYMTDLYIKLQGLYPDIDPSKEPAYQVPANRSNNTKPGAQTPSQASPVPGNKKTPTMSSTPAPPQMQMHMG